LERRLVYLADRSGGERLRLDRLEDVLPRDAELLLHHLHHLGLGQRRDVVLKGRELDDELRREQVLPGRENLAELRIARPELRERVAQPARTDLLRVAAPARLAEPVLGEDRRDPGRPPE